jgi:chlorite dismutase
MTTIATENKEEKKPTPAPLPRQYVSFSCFKVEAAWRRLPEAEKQKGKEEFAAVVKSYVQEKKCQILSYTTMGMRPEVEMMLWIISSDLDIIQKLASDLAKTGLGQYMQHPYSFLAMTKRSIYLDRIDPEHQESRVYIKPGKHKYFFVYPFLKKREWYLLSQPERQLMMDEHIRIGNKYPSVKLNTTYSFGLDDQEFVVAFETDHPADFLDLVQELRESQGSLYTLRDTPILTCIFKEINDTLESLG